MAGRKPGDRPEDAATPEAKRQTFRFDVSAEVLATFREAMARLRRETGGKLDDDQALLLMARHVLGGPRDSGRSSYQVSVTVRTLPVGVSARRWRKRGGRRGSAGNGEV